MGRILFFVGLGIVMYVLMRLVRQGWKSRLTQVKREEPKQTAMIRCPVCGTHFPEDEAVLGAGVKYCSEACRSQARTK